MAAREVPRILIVDDDARLRDTIAEALSWAEGYQVEVARDGYDALTKVDTFHPHLLIHDLQMPGLDGTEVCRRVKANPGTQAIKVLAITAASVGSARDRVLEAGADGFLEKPFQLGDLQCAVARLIGG